MKTLDGVTFTASHFGLPCNRHKDNSCLIEPGETVEITHVERLLLHDYLVAGFTSGGQYHEIEVDRLLCYGAFRGFNTSDRLTAAIAYFRWQRPKLSLEVSIGLLAMQDPRFDIRWWSSTSGTSRWVLYPLPPCPQADREIASVIYHDGYQEYQLLSPAGKVLATFPSPPLREPSEYGDCVTAPAMAISELWNRREALHAEWQSIKTV